MVCENMGLPVNKFIAASNKNNILTDFTTGKYDANRNSSLKQIHQQWIF